MMPAALSAACTTKATLPDTMLKPAARPFAIFLALLAIGLSGCVHRIVIQQGNFLEQKDIDRVAVGMTRVQVRSLLGTPMVADPFQTSRWDYIYYLRYGRPEKVSQRHFIVHFDGSDKVARIENVGPPGGSAAPTVTPADTATPADTTPQATPPSS
jgi:outer membrane protein assembly factor BamE